MAQRNPTENSNKRSEQHKREETLLSARVMARALAELADPKDRLALAQAFCYRLVAAWWAAISDGNKAFGLRDLFAPINFHSLPEPAAASADSIGGAAAELDPESAAYAIGLTYTGMLSPNYRAEFGVFYTPPQLTARLIQLAADAGIDWKTARVLDPACGGGAFLAPVAATMQRALPNVPPAMLVQNIASRLRGFEIDPFAAWLSQVTLDAVMLSVCQRAGKRLPVVVEVCDTIDRSRDDIAKYDLVIGNPPYGKIKLSASDRERFRNGLYGHANLYGLFTQIGIEHLTPDGVLAFVTPTSFLAGEYFKNLRRLLSGSYAPTCLEFVGSRKGVFEGVLQETLLATYQKVQPIRTKVRNLLFEPGGALLAEDAGSFRIKVSSSEPWIAPRSRMQVAIATQLRSLSSRLSDWGYAVSTGPLVWNRHKPQLTDKLDKNCSPIIWAEAVRPDGTFELRATKKNHAQYIKVQSHEDWLLTTDSCVLLQRTTAKEQARRLIATELPAELLQGLKAVVVENHLNMLKPTIAKPKVSAAVLAAFLNSAAADRAFRCLSGSVAVSAYELEALPLPHVRHLNGLRKLISRNATQHEIEDECERLFSLPDEEEN